LKKIILLGLTAAILMTSAPAFSAPADNASPQAFQAQAIKICREMMGGAVDNGSMTKDQLKNCIDMMKTSICSGMTSE